MAALLRQPSSTTSDQGTEGTCYAHTGFIPCICPKPYPFRDNTPFYLIQ